jgi:hypothetical protein
MGIASVAVWRRSRERIAIAVGVPLLLVDVLFLWRYGIDTSRWRVMTSSVALVPFGVLVAALFSADVIGLPVSVAKRTGIGLRDPGLEFDRQLWSAKNSLSRLIEHARSHAANRDADLTAARSNLDHLKRLQPPDEVWAQFQESVVTCEEFAVTLVSRHASADDWQGQRRSEARIADRRVSLLAGLLGHLEISLADQSRKRRRVFVAVFGSGLLVWLGYTVPAVLSASPGPTDPWLWLELSGVTAGLALMMFLVAAAGDAIRRRRVRGSLRSGRR